MNTTYSSKSTVDGWLSQLREAGRQIYAPVTRNGKTNFKRLAPGDDISTAHIQTTQSAKGIVFPRTEKLFSYVKTQNDVTVEDYNPDTLPEVIVFGTRPCDAAALMSLQSILNNGSSDLPFDERRRRITIVSISCTTCDEFCFCTSMNGNPGNTAGSDILLTPIDDGYLIETITDRGDALISNQPGLLEAAPAIRKEEHLAKVPVRFSLETLQQTIPAAFHNEMWDTQSARCLGCGACAFVCPACACFDIQENAKGHTGCRLRCWDACGFSLFTLHTSGHNPRTTQSQRWRQRVMHKFAYMPETLHTYGCTGCGRCSRACPVDMNLSAHLGTFEHTSQNHKLTT
jgi:ferredoxin